MSFLPRLRVRRDSGGSTFTRSRLNLIGGTNVTLSIADDAANDEVDVTINAAAGGGGGGKSYITNPGLKPPASGHADDDEFDQANGTDPTTNGWSWGNQQSVGVTVKHGLCVFDLSSSTSRGFHGLFKAFPASGDVTITGRVNSPMYQDNHGVSLIFLWGTLATPTDLEVVRLAMDTGRRVMWQQWSGYNSFTGTRQSIQNAGWEATYLRLTYDDASGDVQALWTPGSGTNYLALAAAQNKASRPDFYGISGDDHTSASNLSPVEHYFFRVNWTPDFDPTTDD